LGTGAQHPVGRMDVCTCRYGWSFRGVDVGTGAQLPVESVDVRACC